MSGYDEYDDVNRLCNENLNRLCDVINELMYLDRFDDIRELISLSKIRLNSIYDIIIDILKNDDRLKKENKLIKLFICPNDTCIQTKEIKRN